jgi:hypothetical protein
MFDVVGERRLMSLVKKTNNGENKDNRLPKFPIHFAHAPAGRRLLLIVGKFAHPFGNICFNAG